MKQFESFETEAEAGSRQGKTGAMPIVKKDQPEAAGEWMKRGMHDLCQPLMALEFLLYVNREPVAGESLEALALRRVMEEGLAECGRMMKLVRGMQERMQEKTEV